MTTTTKKTTAKGGTREKVATPATSARGAKGAKKGATTAKTAPDATRGKKTTSGETRAAIRACEENLRAIAAKDRAASNGTQDHEQPSPKEVANTPKPAKARKAKAEKPGRPPSGLDLAHQQLVADGGDVKVKDLTERVLAAGWGTKGKTPAATLTAAIDRDIKAKGSESRFEKTAPGTYAARKGA